MERDEILESEDQYAMHGRGDHTYDGGEAGKRRIRRYGASCPTKRHQMECELALTHHDGSSEALQPCSSHRMCLSATKSRVEDEIRQEQIHGHAI